MAYLSNQKFSSKLQFTQQISQSIPLRNSNDYSLLESLARGLVKYLHAVMLLGNSEIEGAAQCGRASPNQPPDRSRPNVGAGIYAKSSRT